MVQPDRRLGSRARLALLGLVGALAALALWEFHHLRAGAVPPCVPTFPDPVPAEAIVPAPPVFLAPGPSDPPVPVVAIRVRVPACAPAGQDLEYRICVENCSAAPAHHVFVRNPLPANARFVRAHPEPAARMPELIWQLGTLPPGACRTITLVLKPVAAGAVKSCARVQFEHGECVCTRIGPPGPTVRGVRPEPAIRLVKQGPARAKLGETLAYHLTVTNLTGKEAAEVKVTDVLPAGLAHASGKDTLTWDLGKLPAGESLTIDYKVVVRKEGRWCNQAVVTAAGGLRDDATHCVAVGEAKLTLAKNGPKARYLNIPVTYFLTVTNPGSLPATNVVITDPVPARMAFVRASHGGRVVDNQVRWDLGTLDPGQSRTVQVVFQAKAAGEVRNQATASADGGLSASAAATTRFRGASAVLVELVDTQDPVAVGSETSYVITVKNQGMVPVTNLRITALVPPEMALVRARGPTGNRPGEKTRKGQPLLFEPLKNLAPGATVTYEVFVKALRPGDARFKADVTADQLRAGGPVYQEESTAIYPEAPPLRI
jgi:uncharacterized repeat protein (TIGR01451 family)